MVQFYNYLSLFFSNAKKVMWLTFVIGIALSIISIFCITGHSNDAGLYIAMAHAFSIGDWNKAFLDNIPPLVPVISGIITKLGISPWHSAMIVGCVFCVLTIFPLYGLLCFFMDKKYAAWGALFYMLAPKMIRFGLSPLLEGSRMFLFILPVYFIFSFANDKKLYKLILLGISLALLGLVRGEGITSMPFILLGLILLCMKKDKYEFSFKAATKLIWYCFFTIVVMLAVLSPRLYQNHLNTGYPALDKRQIDHIKGYYPNLFPKNDFKPQSVQSIPLNGSSVVVPLAEVKKLSFADQKSKLEHFPNNDLKSQNIQPISLNDSSVAVPIAEAKKLSFADQYPRLDFFFKYWKDFSRGSYELYLILSAIGIIFLIYRRNWKLEHGLMILFVFGNGILFYFVNTAYRYYLVNIMLLMPFTLAGYKEVLNKTKKFRVYKIAIGIVLLISIGQIFNGMDNTIDKSKFYTMQAGEWLRQNKKDFQKDANGYPTIFIIGEDCGTNLFNDFNIINPSRSYSSLTLQASMKGVHSDNCLSVVIKTPNALVLKPNIVLLFNPEKFPQEVLYLRNHATFQEIFLQEIKKTLVFKVVN